MTRTARRIRYCVCVSLYYSIKFCTLCTHSHATVRMCVFPNSSCTHLTSRCVSAAVPWTKRRHCWVSLCLVQIMNYQQQHCLLELRSSLNARVKKAVSDHATHEPTSTRRDDAVRMLISAWKTTGDIIVGNMFQFSHVTCQLCFFSPSCQLGTEYQRRGAPQTK